MYSTAWELCPCDPCNQLKPVAETTSHHMTPSHASHSNTHLSLSAPTNAVVVRAHTWSPSWVTTSHTARITATSCWLSGWADRPCFDMISDTMPPSAAGAADIKVTPPPEVGPDAKGIVIVWCLRLPLLSNKPQVRSFICGENVVNVRFSGLVWMYRYGTFGGALHKQGSLKATLVVFFLSLSNHRSKFLASCGALQKQGSLKATLVVFFLSFFLLQIFSIG